MKIIIEDHDYRLDELQSLKKKLDDVFDVDFVFNLKGGKIIFIDN